MKAIISWLAPLAAALAVLGEARTAGADATCNPCPSFYPVEVTVDPDGGTVNLPFGVVVDFPAGAVATTTDIVINFLDPPTWLAGIGGVPIATVSLAPCINQPLLVPVHFRVGIVPPERGTFANLDFLPVGSEADFDEQGAWTPRAPTDAATWHTDAPSEPSIWIVGYSHDVGWRSGASQMIFELNSFGTALVSANPTPHP